MLKRERRMVGASNRASPSHNRGRAGYNINAISSSPSKGGSPVAGEEGGQKGFKFFPEAAPEVENVRDTTAGAGGQPQVWSSGEEDAAETADIAENVQSKAMEAGRRQRVSKTIQDVTVEGDFGSGVFALSKARQATLLQRQQRRRFQTAHKVFLDNIHARYPTVQHFFRQVDKANDGFIGLDDWKSMLRQTFGDMVYNDRDAEALFKQVLRDGQDMLEYRDVQQLYHEIPREKVC